MTKQPGWLKALKSLNKRPPSEDEIQTILASIKADKNDRGVALTLCSAVETALYQFIDSWIVPELNSEEKSHLFSGDAPLGTFSSRIRIAYAFGLIDRDVHKSLHHLREIRNAFAHTMAPISFETPEVAKACELLTLGQKRRLTLTGLSSVGRGRYVGVTGALLFTFSQNRQSSSVARERLPVTFDAVWHSVRQL